MRVSGRVFGLLICALSVVFGGSTFVFGGTPANAVNLPAAESGYVVDEDNAPAVTARVARISFIRGEAKIRHAGSSDWETVALNLPIVEGDEIATEGDSRVEIQFDNYQHLRLAENSYLKVVTLQDAGVALGLSLGTMSVRITALDTARTFFEVDAPRTTVAIQTSGSYRIDAGKLGDPEIRASVTEGGEARIYSDNTGFTLKNNRSARIFVDGPNVGEYEATDASNFSDEFDTWAFDRDSVIAKSLQDAHYNKYYDQDIYGADDLNGNGEWVNTSQYGYVWRPYSHAINMYANWSPYRYGHWRWVPPFGWTWINDEPWGWATYHHGRWFYDAGYWYWSPYGYYRHSRSWWLPALVAINIFNNSIYWYPLPYHCSYYNYNGHYGHHNPVPPVITTGGIKPIPPAALTGGVKPIPPATATGAMTAKDPPTGGIKAPPVTQVPPAGVIGVSTANFGTTVKGGHTPPLSVAKSVLSKPPADLDPPQLPSYSALSGKIGSDIIRQKPKADLIASQTKVGAAPRQQGAPLDKELRTTRVFGGRPPVAPSDTGDTGGVKTPNNGSSDTRPTGAVVRPPIVKPATDPPVRHEPVYSPPTQTDREPQSPPVKPPTRSEPPVKQPTYNPPPVKQPTYTPPARQDPPTKSPPRSEPPKSESKPPAKSPKSD